MRITAFHLARLFCVFAMCASSAWTQSAVLVENVVHSQLLAAGDTHSHTVRVEPAPLRITINHSYPDVELIIREPETAIELAVRPVLLNTGSRSIVYVPSTPELRIEVRAGERVARASEYSLVVGAAALSAAALAAESTYLELAQLDVREGVSERAERLASARGLASQAIEEFEQTQQSNRLADVRMELGAIALAQSRFAEAASLADTVIRSAQDTVDVRSQIIWAYVISGRAHLRQSQLALAESAFAAGLELARTSGDGFVEATLLNYLGLTAQYGSQPLTALSSYELAAARYRELGASHHLAVTLGNVGGVFYQTGQFEPALGRYKQALEVHNQLNDLDGQATVLGNMASLLRDQGQLGKSLELNRRTLDLYDALGNAWGQHLVYHRMGVLYQRMGDWSRARSWFSKAHQGRLGTGSKGAAANSLSRIGDTWRAQKDFGKAMDAYREALSLYRETEHAVNIGRTEVKLARCLLETGDLSEAETVLAGTVETFRAASLVKDLARAELTLGVLFGRQGKATEALKKIHKSLSLFEKADNPIGEAEALFELGVLEQNAVERLAVLERARNRLDAVRQNIFNPRHRATFAATQSEVDDLMIVTLVALHRQSPEAGYDRKAYMISERSRARSLLEWLGRSERHASDEQMSMIERRRALQFQFNALWFSRSASVSEKTGSEARRAFENTAKALLEVRAELDELDGRLLMSAGQTTVHHITAERVQSQLAADQALLHYHVGLRQGVLWVVTAEKVDTVTLPGREELSRAVRDALPAFQHGGGEQARESLATLSSLLLPDLIDFDSVSTLLLVPDTVLRHVPFSALTLSTGVYVAEVSSVTEIPSASTLLRPRWSRSLSPSDSRVAVFADPVFQSTDTRLHIGRQHGRAVSASRQVSLPESDEWASVRRLPYTSSEAESIEAVYPGVSVYKGLEATKEAVLEKDLTQFDVIHFATHGLVNPFDADLSGLLMSRYDQAGNPIDGFLSLGEISTLRLNAPLVLLSACDSGLGENLAAEGLVSLGRAFLAQGARQVVTTLWPVADRPTTLLVGEFHRLHARTTLRPVEALRQAQVMLINSELYSDPYYWAGFSISSMALSELGP